jgi:hypothetical protein
LTLEKVLGFIQLPKEKSEVSRANRKKKAVDFKLRMKFVVFAAIVSAVYGSVNTTNVRCIKTPLSGLGSNHPA